jgi:formylmethanofuran dehydrogenase subunit C
VEPSAIGRLMRWVTGRCVGCPRVPRCVGEVIRLIFGSGQVHSISRCVLIELTLQPGSHGRYDGSVLRTERLLGRSPLEIANDWIPSDSGGVPLGALFSIQLHDSEPDVILVRGDCRCFDHFGSHHASGSFIVDGHVGDRFGAHQRGGRLIVLGSAGDFAFEGRLDGEALVVGDVGDALAAPAPGAKSGMRGGDLMVLGSVGERACERMRRGTVAIGGDVGEALAAQMIAGTIVVFGEVGANWGWGMRRGSLILAHEPQHDSAGAWSQSHDFELSFLPLIWRHVSQLQSELAAVCRSLQPIDEKLLEVPTTRWVRRQVGDMHVEGRGEVLVLQRVSRGRAVPSVVERDSQQ